MRIKFWWVVRLLFLSSILFFLIASRGFSQNYNPSFPRVVFQRPAGSGHPHYSDGTTALIFSKFDLAVFTGLGDGGRILAEQIRKLNPNTIVLGTSKQGVWPGSDPGEFFAVKSICALLQQDLSGGETQILVNSTQGFPTGRYKYGIINGDVFSYAGMEGNKFVGIPSSGELAVEAHSKGEKVKTPIRFGGFGMLPDFTDFAPTKNGKTSWQYFVDRRFEKTDYSKFDGSFYDAFRQFFYNEELEDIDFNRNDVNDREEFGMNWINEQWEKGITKLLQYERQKLQEVNPSKVPIIAVNFGGGGGDYLFDLVNGIEWEGFMRFAWNWQHMVENMYSWMGNGQKPIAYIIEDYVKEKHQKTGKNDFRYMRYGLTTTLMGDGYYGRTFGDYYYISLWYDEFEANLGYPTTDAQQLPSGVWVRFFDHGAVICNPTGHAQVATDSDIQGLSGYKGPYYRFLGGQDPDFNNGSLFDRVELYGELGSREKHNKGDGILLFDQPTTAITDIVVGNYDNNDTSPGSSPAEYEGNWTPALSKYIDPQSNNPYYTQWIATYEIYGTCEGYGYFYSPPGNGENVAIYRPTIGVPGYYQVFEWHGWHGSQGGNDEASNVPHEIHHANGTTKGTVDQTRNYGKWNYLGIFYLNKGKEGFVKITNNANGIVIADAFKFVYKENGEVDAVPPNEPRVLKSENKTENSLTLSWLPPLVASDGDLASSYKLYRDSAFIGTTSDTIYTDAGLFENTTYNYAVYAVDDVGNISASAATGNFTTLVDVTPPDIKSVKTLYLNLVEIVFSEAVEQISAEDVNNYSIDNGISISQAILYNLDTVHLTTSAHSVGKTYTIVINNIKDRASTPNIIAANSTSTYVGVGENISISISVDNEYELYVNGSFVGADDAWENAETYSVPSIRGRNVIAVKAIDSGGLAGLVAEIHVGGNLFVSDERWKVSTILQTVWESTSFDDGSWNRATSFGLHGVASPWAYITNVQGISTTSGTKWIWSSDNLNDDTVYFRFSFTLTDVIPPSPPQGVRVERP